MIILVSGVTKTVKKNCSHKHLGELITPQRWGQIPKMEKWAADNAAYSNWDEEKFATMLHKIKSHSIKPIFVACPDVVGNAIETSKLFDKWQPQIKELGLRVSLVLQNGQQAIGVPWDNIDSIFIGGDDLFKLGGYVRYIVGVANSRGKWVHMGRVNSIRRMLYARKIGCDSIDGTGFSMFPDTYIPKYLRILEKEQMALW